MSGKEKRKREKKKEKPPQASLETVMDVSKRDNPETMNNNDITADIAVPHFPTVVDSSEDVLVERIQSKQQVIVSVPLEKLTETDEPAFTYYDFGNFVSSTATNEDNTDGENSSYLANRPLSLQACRFELPMDVKVLESLTPQEYLRKYCIISKRRESLYSKIFLKHRQKFSSLEGKERLCKALKDTLVNAIRDDQADDLFDLLEIYDDTTVDLRLFSGVAALAERILFGDFINKDTADKTEYQRERIECADFCALKWKLHGIKVNHHVRKLLESLG